jgi:hypothetical protein
MELAMKVLKSHEFTRASVGNRVHDWDTLMDGQIRQLEADDLGNATVKTFRMMAYKQGIARQKQVKIEATEDGGVIVQALTMTKEQLADREVFRASLRAARAAKKAASDNGQPTEPAKPAKAKKTATK